MAPNSILASQLLKIFLGLQPPDSSLNYNIHSMLIFCFAPYGRCIQSCLPNLKLLPPPLKEDVIIFCLPPHTTADSQPLDTSCFGPLKTYWFEIYHQYLFSNPGRVIAKFQFSRLFAQAWSKGMTIDNIVSDLRGTGIYPFKPNTVLDKLTKPKDNLIPRDVEPKNSSSPSRKDEENISQQSSETCFTSETIKLYEKRLENGYDVYDANYPAWLEKFHPDCLPSIL